MLMITLVHTNRGIEVKLVDARFYKFVLFTGYVFAVAVIILQKSVLKSIFLTPLLLLLLFHADLNHVLELILQAKALSLMNF